MSEYDSMSKYYDFALFPALYRMRKTIANYIKKYEAQKVIDLCCGTGNQLKYLKNTGLKQAVGVDIDPSMLAVAHKNNLNCQLQDATQTTFQDSEFDLAIVTLALHEKNKETAKAIVDEAKRIVKPGGYFMAVDYAFDKKANFFGKKITTRVEKYVGGEHYANFKSFIQYGGLNELVDLPLVDEKRFHLGATVLKIYKNNK